MTPEREQRELLAAWMIANGYATGHGDNVAALLGELKWQIDDRLQRAVAEERERCAVIAEKLGAPRARRSKPGDVLDKLADDIQKTTSTFIAKGIRSLPTSGVEK